MFLLFILSVKNNRILNIKSWKHYKYWTDKEQQQVISTVMSHVSVSQYLTESVLQYLVTLPSSFLGGSLQAVLHMLTKELKYLSRLSSVFRSSRANALNWDQSKVFLSGS